MWKSVSILSLCVAGALGFGNFRNEIPNGDHVPHPCKPNYIWHGVGHTNPAGGGARNPFGQDFDSQGHKWTVSLCRMDSDGDGRTNGEELGDPDCTWRPGQSPKVTKDITHPGVCEPMNEGVCASRNAWVDCNVDSEFKCDAINQPDVRNLTIRFPRTKVPAQETSYVCFNFELPSDQEYHLIATEAIIDNANVMHHMVLSECADSVGMVDEAQECMGQEGCGSILSLWGLGATGQCFNPKAGFRIGKGATKVLSLQHHWTNPSLVEDYTDASGMILYYTPKLRQYNAGVFSLAQLELNIPPRQPSVTEVGTCTEYCSHQTFSGDIHIMSAFNHMHYLGIAQNFSITRPGQAPLMVTDDESYRYDSPSIYEYPSPITVHPGDKLTTHCTFQSLSRTEVTNFGAGSYDEMCIVFFTFYPVENTTSTTCSQYGKINTCGDADQCEFAGLSDISHPTTKTMIEEIMEDCDATGETCKPSCPAAVAEMKRENPCVRYNWEYVQEAYTLTAHPSMLAFLKAMESCDHRAPETHVTPAQSTGPASMFMDIIKHLDARPLLQNIIMNVNYNYGHAPPKDDKDDHQEMWH